MKNNLKNNASILICLIVILFLTGTVSAQETRPFKGRIVGQFVSTPTADPAIFLSEARARGFSTQTGRFTKVTNDVFNILTGEVTGTFEMTTAGGDLVNGQYAGYVVPETPTTFYWRLDASITGGTGRFANAAGDFVFFARGDYYFENGSIMGSYTETFEGTMTF